MKELGLDDLGVETITITDFDEVTELKDKIANLEKIIEQLRRDNQQLLRKFYKIANTMFG